MRLTRRTLLASGLLSACGGTATLESLKLTVPPATDQTPLPIDARCCTPIDDCGVAPSVAPVPRVNDTLGVRWFLALTGQSNAVGRAPAITTAQPFSNQLGSGVELPPLVEIEKESIKSAAANMLTHLSGGLAMRLIATNGAVNSTPYTGLKKGSAAYTRLMRQVASSKRAVTEGGGEMRALALLVIHGEDDHVAQNAHYAADLREWQSDNEADIRAVTGQNEAVPIFTDQLASWTYYGQATSLIPLAQLAASVENQNRIFCVGPKYQFGYADGKHLVSSSYQWLGEQYGKVMKRVFVDGVSWRPLSPREVVAPDAKTIRARFFVPEPPLVFDTMRVLAKENMGFELGHADASVKLPTIDRVSIVADDTVELALTGELPSCARLRYAATGKPRAWAGTTGEEAKDSARGNLRDSDTTASFAGSWELFNWCAVFDAPIAT